MKKRSFLCLLAFPLFLSCAQQEGNANVATTEDKPAKANVVSAPADDKVGSAAWVFDAPDGVSLCEVETDSLDIRNPFVMYEPHSNMYYMTGDGGCMWTSSDAQKWKGPYKIIDMGEDAWMGNSYTVTSPELYRRNEKYCLVASFGYADTTGAEKHECAVLVADDITGPYRLPDKPLPLTPASDNAKWPTYANDGFGNTCVIYACNADNADGAAMKVVMLAEGQNTSLGEPYEIMDISMLPWRSNVIESPEFFTTAEGEYGILFTSDINGKSVVGIAYSAKELGHPINGPWVVEKKAFLEGRVGGASLFTDYDGTDVLVMHKEVTENGNRRYVPCFLKMDTQFEKLENKGNYNF